MTVIDELERRHTLLTAAARYDALRAQDALATPDEDDPADVAAPALTREETLEMLALGELLARKATYGRQLGVRSARRAGASWSQIGSALGASKQAAWEAHQRWIDDQSERHGTDGVSGMDDAAAATVRALAGGADD